MLTDRGPRFRRTKRGALVVATTLLAALASGCSPYMAAHQTPRKDVSVLETGTPRAAVIAELGTPLLAEKRDGKSVDVFAFTQGYGAGSRAARAAFHAIVDVATLGLWEIIGIPTETIFTGTDVRIQVSYDQAERVERVRAFEGESVLRGRSVPLVD